MSNQTPTANQMILQSSANQAILQTPTTEDDTNQLIEQTPTMQPENEKFENAVVSHSAGVPFYSLGGKRIWYPSVNDKPIVGTIYDTLDAAYSFYQEYARQSGFVTKRSSSRNPKRIVNPPSKYFRCNREGKKNSRPTETALRPRKTSSFRTGCQARIFLKKCKDGKYRLEKFVEGHNHYLLHKTDMKFVKSSRLLGYMKEQFLFQVSTLNIGPVKGFKLLKELYGGFEEVGDTKVDCKNFRRDITVFVGKEDAQMAVEKLLAKMQFVKDFYVEYFLKPDNTLAGVFWADPEAHRNYRLYGDVVSFDSTFRSNTYGMVFVPFTGIDNHNRCVTFGSALLTNETEPFYEWLLNAFKRAFKCDPIVVVTDQDQSMKAAIKECFPNTRHRLCMWHIMKKMTTKVGTVLCNTTDFKKRICNIVWTDKITPETFESEWQSLIQEFNLSHNTWLQEIYDIRNTWIPAYLLDEPLAGLMRTSSRSESENHFFSKFTNPYLTLVEFLTHYDTAMEHQRYVQQKNDHDTMYTIPDFKTDLYFEVSASLLFTRTIFYEVQDELVASFTRCMSLTVEKYEDREKYVIQDKDHDVKVYEVDYIPSEVTAQCTCKNFELYGLLCRHVYYVFRVHNIKHYPKKYVLKRWSIEAIPKKEENLTGQAHTYTLKHTQARIRDMLQIVEDTANRLIHDDIKFDKYKERLMELLQETKAEFPTAKRMDKYEAICSFYGVQKPKEVTIKNPPPCKTKGRKRRKSKEEIESNKKAKKIGNQCGTCKGYGHNSRRCTGKKTDQSVLNTSNTL